MTFENTYADRSRAQAYDELGLGGTYSLVFDVLPGLLSRFVSGRKALDFGCGTGRSTRFIKRSGFKTVGIDISEEMVAIARERDPKGDYNVIGDGDFDSLQEESFDLILSAFTFDNIPGRPQRIHLFKVLSQRLKPDGVIINIVSTPEIYTNEWVTFTTKAFPENRNAQSGETVKIITLSYSDQRPVEDILWTDDDYQSVYSDCGLKQIDSLAPLARGDGEVQWKSETRIPPWRIYILKRYG